MLMFTKRMKENVKKNRKGYTLTELIVVVAILGILAAVGAPMILNQISTARTNADAANAKQISNAFKIYAANNTVSESQSGVTSAVKANLKTIPTAQGDDKFWAVNIETGECMATGSAINTITNKWVTITP
jgi:type IV pilus assembly protein PilA